MPRVGKKHFPYTPKGKADARKERLVDAMERAQNESSRLQTNDAMRRGGYDRKPGLRPVPGRAPYRPHPNPPPKGFRPPKKTCSEGKNNCHDGHRTFRRQIFCTTVTMNTALLIEECPINTSVIYNLT